IALDHDLAAVLEFPFNRRHFLRNPKHTHQRLRRCRLWRRQKQCESEEAEATVNHVRRTPVVVSDRISDSITSTSAALSRDLRILGWCWPDVMQDLHPHDESRSYRYCPRCGHGLEKRSLKPNEPDRLVCPRCSFVFYIDPKIAVGTVIRSESGRIVLVRRAI